MSSYEEWLRNKEQLGNRGGFEPIEVPGFLFDFQKVLVEWSIIQGRGAIFADCGMGKTPMELVWADNVHRKTGKPVLLLTPLAVGFQVENEARKFHLEASMSRNGKPSAPITVTNYEQLEKFKPEDFGGVVCDESSAIKCFDGVRREIVTEFMRTMQYRLLGTATAAPNDYIELGTSSEALGNLGHIDMLNRFFINKQRTSDTKSHKYKTTGGGGKDGWRFKGHAEGAFWKWVSSWARAIRKPSDYGFADGSFVLPELREEVTLIEARTPRPDMLFDLPAIGLAEERSENNRTVRERCETAAGHLGGSEPGVAWCHMNEEGRLLTKLIDGAVEVSGSDSIEAKEEKLSAFSAGQIRVLVTKPKIGAWGLNWQHCNRMTYFPSHSYEQYYQAIRRSWRFGQTKPVTVHIVTTPGGATSLENMQRKGKQADEMFSSLLCHMSDAMKIEKKDTRTKKMELPSWI